MASRGEVRAEARELGFPSRGGAGNGARLASAAARLPARIRYEAGPGRGLWRELAGLGPLGMTIPERLGGTGFGLLEAALVTEQAGATLPPVPYLPAAVAAAVWAEVNGGEGSGPGADVLRGSPTAHCWWCRPGRPSPARSSTGTGPTRCAWRTAR
ncbi:acyl-CoA dehydrogenase family protein [Streptomyces sp. NPDC002566]|uniref:acyl-CoA dehydrogenase family protein n=1 Tax=Streptomyces sp. NPDC002566 TaxID=3364650 RepID=UPI0036ABF066